MMLQPTQQPGPINLAKSITALNSQWNTITEAIKRNFDSLRGISEYYGEFRSKQPSHRVLVKARNSLTKWSNGIQV